MDPSQTRNIQIPSVPQSSIENPRKFISYVRLGIIIFLSILVIISSLYLTFNIFTANNKNQSPNPTPTPILTNDWTTYTSDFTRVQIRYPKTWGVNVSTQRLPQDIDSLDKYITYKGNLCINCRTLYAKKDIIADGVNATLQEGIDSSLGRGFFITLIEFGELGVTIDIFPPNHDKNIPFSEEQKGITNRIVSTFKYNKTSPPVWKTFTLLNMTFRYPETWPDPQYNGPQETGVISNQENSQRITVASGQKKGEPLENLTKFIDGVAGNRGRSLQVQGNPAARTALANKQGVKIINIYILAPDKTSLFQISLEADEKISDGEIESLFNQTISTIEFTDASTTSPN